MLFLLVRLNLCGPGLRLLSHKQLSGHVSLEFRLDALSWTYDLPNPPNKCGNVFWARERPLQQQEFNLKIQHVKRRNDVKIFLQYTNKDYSYINFHNGISITIEVRYYLEVKWPECICPFCQSLTHQIK